MPRKLAFICSTLLLGLTLGLGASGAVGAEKLDMPVHVRFATARPGITWYSYAGVLRPHMLKVLPAGSDVTIMNTALAIANAKLLITHRADIGFSYPPVVEWAEKGFGPFSAPAHDLRGLVGSLDQYYQRITLQKNSPINSLAEIKAKHLAVHIGTNTPGSLNEYMTQLILKAYGLTYDDIKQYGGSVTEAGLPVLSNLFGQGRIDMIIGITTAGHPNTAQLASAPGEKFLGLDEHAIHFLAGYGFAPATMPANLFPGQPQPIRGRLPLRDLRGRFHVQRRGLPADQSDHGELAAVTKILRAHERVDVGGVGRTAKSARAAPSRRPGVLQGDRCAALTGLLSG